MKRFYTMAITALLGFATLSQAVAQSKTVVKGTVIDASKKPVDFAKVALLNSNDSSVVRSTLTDASGSFTFENVEPKEYVLSIAVLGKKTFSKKITATDASFTDLGATVLGSESTKLREVTITATKPFIERKADKLIMNVEGSAISTGSTALEVLQKAPGVTLDKDDNISMNGKSAVLVMLDGKPTYMSNADLANMLRGMQSNQIETIELITNPSAKYDAAGNAGIINIKTKRDQKLGFNGTATLGSGYGRTSKYNASTNLNFRKGKLNIFGRYNYSNNGNKSDFELNRRVAGAGSVTKFSQGNEWDARRNNNSYKLGADLFVSKKTTVGFLWNGYTNGVEEKVLSGTSISSANALSDSSIDVNGNNTQRYKNNAFNFNYKTTFDSLGRELSFDVDYSDYSGKLDEYRNSTYINFANNPALEQINNLAPAKIEIRSAKLDYSHPLSKSLKLEAGLKSSWVKTDNNLKFSTLQSGQWALDLNRSNYFIYTESINAAYVNINKEFKTVSLQFGLRGEHTYSKGNSVTLNSIVPRDYFKLFPSLSISKKISKDHQMGISYSRRIDRPSYDNLNPFIYILDKYTYEQGNSYLNPQYTHSGQLSYTYKGSTTATLSYSKTTDVMTQITEQNDATKITYAQQRNLESQTVYSFNVYAPVPVTKWWKLNNNVQVFNMGFTADLFGERLKVNQTVFQTNIDNQFTINKTLNAELSTWYMSPLQYGIFKIRNSPYLNVGFRKSFQQNKVNLKLSFNDIFNTMTNKGSTTYSNMDFNFSNKWESRVMSFSLSYRFGSNDVKPERKRSTGLESEANRMKN